MLIYTVITRGNLILSEWSSDSGNCGTITRAILPNIISHRKSIRSIDDDVSTTTKSNSPGGDDQQAKSEEPYLVSYMYDQKFVFHCFEDNVSVQGISFIALCERELSVKIAFRYLMTVCRKFAAFCESQRIDPYKSMANSISNEIIQNAVQEYAAVSQKNLGTEDQISNPDVRIIKDKIKNINEIFSESLESIAARNGHIQILVERTNQLNDTTNTFQRKTRAIAHREWWKVNKLLLGGALVIVGFVSIFLTVELTR